MLHTFSENTYGESFWFHHVRQHVTWFPLGTQFVQFCRETIVVVVLSRVESVLENAQFEEQNGFRQGSRVTR